MLPCRVTLLPLLVIAALLAGCIIPPQRPEPPVPGGRLAARKIPTRGVSPKDVWKKEIEKMGAEPLALDPSWFNAFPDGRTPHEIVENFLHEYNMSDLWVKEMVAVENLFSKWQQELTEWLEENSLEFMDEDKDKLKDWKESQSPPWPPRAPGE